MTAGAHQAVQWVALPAGVDGDRARITVFVAPQLTVDGDEQVLSTFEDWMDWPARLAQTSFYVELDDGTAVPATLVGSAGDSAMWRALFPPTTPLRSFQAAAPADTMTFASYSVPAVDDILRRAYTRAAVAAIGEQPADTLADCFAEFADLYRDPSHQVLLSGDRETLADDLSARATFAQANRAADTPPTLLPPANTATDHLAAAVAFHRRATGPRQQQEPVQLDFHQLLTSLGDQPALLRLLGLVRHIEIPAGTIRPSGRLRLRPLWTPPNPVGAPSQHDDLVPWIEYQAAAPVFTATSHSGPPGLVDLAAGGYQLSQVDLDGAVHKTLAMVANLAGGGTTDVAPPALRSGGISLVRPDRVSQLHGHLSTATANLNTTDPVLTAEDVTRGYRIDVYDNGSWRSLHTRQVTYTVAGSPLLEAPVQDEGFLQDTVVSGEGNNITYLHENMATWDGWSLAAARPELALSTDAEAVPVRIENTPHTSTNLKVDTTVTPGTLPRLRFGREYRLRLRTVDLAGDGPDLAAADAAPADVATAPLTYRRFEPVPAPEIVPLPSYVEGKGQVRMVVRGVTVTQSPLDASLTAPDVRELVPPKTSLRMVELHGLLDTALGGSAADRAEAYQIASRESGTLESGLVDGELPYLPDPMCAGVVFFDLPGRESPDPLVVDFDRATWHQPRPIRLRLLPFPNGADPVPEWDAEQRQLTVWLRPAKVWTIRIASKIADPTLLALPHWGSDATDELVASAAAGGNVLFGPQREITLVHAVPQPANWLELTDFRPYQNSDSSTSIPGHVPVDADSTQRVDLVASWSEMIDDGVRAPWRRSMTAVVAGSQIPLPPKPSWYYVPNVDIPLVAVGKPYSFGPRKHRKITFQAVATGRFHDHFPDSYAATPDAFTAAGPPITWSMPNTAPPPPPVVLEVVPVLDRYTDASGILRSGGWLRVYLDRPWYVTGDGELLGVVTVDPQPSGPEDPLYGMVSLCGQDETRFSANVPGLRPGRMLESVAGRDDVRLPGNSTPVSVAGYPPEFEAATGRWACDIRVDLGDAYFPFVRLAVVRWQPNATSDEDMVSGVVLLDIVQTVPSRFLSSVRGPDGLVHVSLLGASYVAVADQSSPAFQPAGRATVTVRAQRRDPGIADDLIAWSDIGDPVELTRPFATYKETWQGSIRPPAAAPGERLRLLVVEEDHIAADLSVPGYAGRIVYAETIPLS